MSWEKREPVSNLVVLGDDENNAKKVGGLLLAVVKDAKYANRSNYQIVQKDGTVSTLAGSASLNNQIHEGDVGKFIKAEFKGWGKSPNGRYKEIEVLIWEGEPTEDMKNWPRFKDAQKKASQPDPEPAPEPDEDFGGDEDLPF